MVAGTQALYKAAKKRFDAEPEFKARAREAVTQLQAGNELFLQARLRARLGADAMGVTYFVGAS